MNRIRVFLACLVCRWSRWLLALLGRGGTSLPGKLALRLCPTLLQQLARGVEVVAVTGTNGKTTTAEILRRMAQVQGIPCISNVSGANLQSGIVTAFAGDTDFWGKTRKKLAIIECDEAAFARTAGALRPRVIVVTNLFRDQLDRYGELSTTREKLRSGIADAPGALLCLNADCSLTATLAPSGAEVRFFGLDCDLSRSATVYDAMRCPDCGTAYVYDSRSFAHLGHWRCPGCGKARPEPQVSVREIRPERGGSTLEVSLLGETRTLRSSLESDHNAYNAAAALCAATALNWDPDAACGALATVHVPFGRTETIRLGGREAKLVLAKNPVGMDCALRWLAAAAPDSYPVFCINDNLADGTDVSWLWDADFEGFLAASGCTGAGVYGLRRGDMLLRLLYAGSNRDKLDVREFTEVEQLRALIEQSTRPVSLIANYTAMCALRKQLTHRAFRREGTDGA